MKELLKGSIEDRAFQMSLWRHRPTTPEEGKGGVKIWGKCREIEEMFAGHQVVNFDSSQYRNLIDPPKGYTMSHPTQGESQNMILLTSQRISIERPGGQTYVFKPDFRVGMPLYDEDNGLFGAAWMRCVGLGLGITWTQSGIYSRTMLESYVSLVREYVRKVFQQIVNPVRFDLTVERPEREDQTRASSRNRA